MIAGSSVMEPSRRLPLARETDVLVCGGGPAGIAAAFTAARCGAKTLLLERHPFLGGVWTAGALTILIDTENRNGLNREIRQRLEKRQAAVYCSFWPEWTVYGLEAMKGLLDDMVRETGTQVQLYTQVASVIRQGRQLAGVITESKSGREFIKAKIIIDTTGDGDVAAQAGCPFELGRPEDGKMQPMTLYGRIGGYRGSYAHIEPMLTIARRGGLDPSYGRVTLFPQPNQPGVFMLMATHLYGNGIDVRDLTQAEMNARREIGQLVDVLKRHGGDDWKDIYLIDTGPFVGIRETRRIRGQYYLTFDDLRAGRRFDDGICHVRFGIDIHHPDPSEGRGLKNISHPFYDIPFRSLLPLEVDNLMMAGRCISGDHLAMASYRVTGDAVAMGEAVGVAASMCVQADCLPSQLDTRQLLQKLADARENSWDSSPMTVQSPESDPHGPLLPTASSGPSSWR